MARIQRLTPDRLSTEQRLLYDAILAGRRAQSAAVAAPSGAGDGTGASVARPGSGLLDEAGALVGPFNAWLLSPEIGERIQRLGEAIRFGSALPNNALEVAILVVGADWRAEFEWWAHARLARRAGVDAEVIAAIKDGRKPSFSDAGEEAAYRFAKELLERRRVSEETYRLARERFGENGVMDLVTLLGYYTMVSMTLNVFEVPLPEGQLLTWGDGADTVI
jgi:4-carboxymuconolactone decarboxylase